jgi:uncharacterized protein involved in cysteine biosynthesis
VPIALIRAFRDLAAPPLRHIVVIGLALTLATFAALWLITAWVIAEDRLLSWTPLDWLAKLLGALAVLGLTWLLFPAIATLVMGFFLDRVAAAVEALDYPGKGPATPPPLSQVLFATARLMGLALLLNLLALPLYLMVPGINLLVFLALNGYLLGREYFEVVALRRLDIAAARAARLRFGGRVFLGGVVIAGLFALPLLNLVAPVVATAFMVHLFEGLPRIELRAS